MPEFRKHIQRGLFGLQFKTTLLLTAIVLAATGLTGATYLHISTKLAVQEARRHAVDMVKALAIAGARDVRTENRAGLLDIAANFVAQGELSYIIFSDMTGHILASHQHGAGHIERLLIENGTRILVTPLNQPRLVHDPAKGTLVDIVYPVTAGLVWDIKNPTPTIGYVRLGLNLSQAAAQLEQLRRDVVWLAVAIALLMVPIGFETVRYVVGPLNKLALAARAFASGELGVRVPVKGWGEISDLKRAFNNMADQISTSHAELVQLNAELEERVKQRTHELEAANDMLSEMAIHDSLTGLFNRRQFVVMLDRLFAEASRYDTDLTCLMLDLDNFKLVNDTHGHQVGDQLLQLVSEVLKMCIRETDVAVRLGGDEFAVLFPQTRPREAANCAERILSAFREEVNEKLRPASFATLSIGLASRELDMPKTGMDLVKLADEALYMAKASGKNRIRVKRPTVQTVPA